LKSETESEILTLDNKNEERKVQRFVIKPLICRRKTSELVLGFFNNVWVAYTYKIGMHLL